VKVALTAHFGARPLALEEWGGAVLPFPMVPRLKLWRFDVSTPVTSTALIGVYGVLLHGPVNLVP